MTEDKARALQNRQLQEAIQEFQKVKVKELAEGKLSELARKKRLHELEEQEKQVKENIRVEFNRLQSMVNEAKDYAEALGMTVNEALLLLTWREVKFIHWDMDNTLPNILKGAKIQGEQKKGTQPPT